MDLFTQQDLGSLVGTPLAEKMRPQSFSDFYGHESSIKQVKNFIQQGYLPNLILWGPPGTGKTTLAKILCQNFEAHWIQAHSTETTTKQLKEFSDLGKDNRIMYQKRTVLFVDEIHRFNKSQQDVLLPSIEAGHFTLVGATTENPSYELNRALMSRCKLMILKKLTDQDLKKIASNAFDKNNIPQMRIDLQVINFLTSWCAGDARRLLMVCEEIICILKANTEKKFELDDLKKIIETNFQIYDKNQDEHYNTISAFIKSIRGSDPDSALLYLAKMLAGGEDPIFIARRLVILASEDVGNADPQAINLAVNVLQAVELVGMPEARINLAQAVCYLACAPKSNRSYVAINKAEEFVNLLTKIETPDHLKSSYSNGKYIYPHDSSKSYVKQNYWPDNISRQKFYEPKEIGFERKITEWLKYINS